MKKTLKKKEEDVIQTFSLAFMGEYLNIVTDLVLQDKASNEETIVEQTTPLVATGFLLDEDEHFLYLGNNPFEITKDLHDSNPHRKIRIRRDSR